MRTFVAVVDSQSFTAAADRLGVAKSVASRRVTDLEAELGTLLVRRTTRSVTPTDAGLEYYKGCLEVLDQFDMLNQSMQQDKGVVGGRLRLSLPITYTEMVMMPVMEQFIAAYPDLSLELDFSDTRVDLLGEGYDAALRIGALEDSALFARKLGTTSGYICASPAYLAQNGTPEHPRDLAQHTCLFYTNTPNRTEWVFGPPGDQIRQRVAGRIRSNSGRFNMRLAVAGLGIVAVPDFMARPLLDDGALVTILDDFASPPIDVHVVYADKDYMSPGLRAFIDFMVARLAV